MRFWSFGTWPWRWEFNPVAAAAFIGEHTYSSEVTPIAVGRPDDDDVRNAEGVGEAVRKKLVSCDGAAPIDVPGDFPYKEIRMLSGDAPSVDEAACIRCRACLPLCPSAAIDAINLAITDSASCIRCCACVKVCPAGARKMDDPRIRQLAEMLSSSSVRREPEIFL